MSRILMKDMKSPVMVIYGKVDDVDNTKRIKGKRVSYIKVKTLNKRIHKLLYYGIPPKYLMGQDVYRSFVVQEQVRVHTWMERLVNNKVSTAMGKGSSLTYVMEDMSGNKIEKEIPKSIEAKEIYVQHKERVTDLVIFDIDLDPKGI